MSKQKLEPELKKYGILLLIAGILLGILVTNGLEGAKNGRAGILSDYFIRQYSYVQIDRQEFFYYLIGKRLRWIPVLWLLGLTAVGIISAALWMIWLGFSGGILITIAVTELGAKGILFCFAALFPQGFLYGAGWFCLLYGIYRKQKHQRSRYRAYILSGAVSVLLMIFGIFLESSVNLWILEGILKFF